MPPRTYKKKMVSKMSKDCAKISSAASKIQSAWRGRKSKTRTAGPAKEKGSVAKALSQIAERKIQPIKDISMKPPDAQAVLPLSGPVYFSNYILGTQPAAWIGPTGAPNYEALGGYNFPQSLASNGRVGKYMFLEHAMVNLNVSMKAISNRNPEAVQFRVLCYKFKRNQKLGSIGNPNDDLFMSSSGGKIGVNTFFDNTNSPGSANFNLMNAIVNRKNYQVFSDEKFILQPSLTIPQGGGYVTPSTGYPVMRDMSFKLNHNEKTEFGAASQPVDLQYQYCFTILSVPVGSLDKIGVDDWSTSLRGTVSALDS